MRPNWFASVMGTGIVANAALLLPFDLPGRHELALVMWLLACALLTVLVVGTLVRRRFFAAHLPFYGCVPMAFLTVGAGSLSIAHSHTAALTLWILGTAGGLATAALIPSRLHGDVKPTWLLPVVPPMVSASTGAALGLHPLCWICFAISLVATLWLLPRIPLRVPREATPTLWMVLGPLGQSVTAVNLLGHFELIYGVPVWICAMGWLGFSLWSTLRDRPPFTLAWWAFTFPLGTVVTATSELALHFGALRWVAGVLFAGLLLGWGAAASGTLRYLSAAWSTTRAAGAAVAPPAP